MGEGAKSGPTFNGGYYSAGAGGGRFPSPTGVRKLPRTRNTICCGPLCILKLLLKIAITIIFIVGIVALVAWLVLRPSKPKFYVDSVQINNVTNSSNIVLAMSVRNANKKISIYYDALFPSANYGGNYVGGAALEEFRQGHKNTTTLHPEFDLPVALSANSEGVAALEVKLRSRVRIKVWKIKSNRYTLKVKCGLSVPLNDGSAFTRKKCKVKFER